MILSLVLALVMGLSLLACGNDGDKGSGGDDKGPGGNSMTQEKWQAAFDKSDTFPNRTVIRSYDMGMRLMYNGAEVTETTDFGGDMTGKDLLDMFGPMLDSSVETEKYLIDAENGKLNGVEERRYSFGVRTYLSFCRMNDKKLERTYIRNFNEKYVHKEIYGPYSDAATIKKILVNSISLKQNAAEFEFTDKNGQPLDILKDYQKFTYKNGVYSIDMGIANEFPKPLYGTGSIKMTDDYVSEIKMDIKAELNMDEAIGIDEGEDEGEGDMDSLPEGVAIEMYLKSGITVTDVGTTAVTDTGLEEADEENTAEYPVITAEEQFKSLFGNIEDGIGFQFDDNNGTNCIVEIRKTSDGYDAYVEERTYNDDTDKTEFKSYYYIAKTGAGIQKYVGEYEGSTLVGWGAPTKASDTATLAALCAFFPTPISDYLATYDNDKPISELYSMFEYIRPTTLSAVLTNANKTVTVQITFGGEENLYIEDLQLNNKNLWAGSLNNLEYYHPSTFGQD